MINYKTFLLPFFILFIFCIYSTLAATKKEEEKCVYRGKGKESVECYSLAYSDIHYLLSNFSSIKHLTIREWDEKSLNLSLLAPLSLLSLDVQDASIYNIISCDKPGRLSKLAKLNLDNNYLYDWSEICVLLANFGSLQFLSLSSNHFEQITACNSTNYRLENLQLSNNKINNIYWMSNKIKVLNISYNNLHEYKMSDDLPRSLVSLSLSSNPLSSLSLPTLPLLQYLNLSSTNMNFLPILNTPKLKELTVNNNKLMVFSTPLVRVKVGATAIIGCTPTVNSVGSLDWWRVRPATYIGTYHFASKRGHLRPNISDRFDILNGGSLLIKDVTHADVERYACVGRIKGEEEKKVSSISHLRLDYSDWYSIDILSSVFWGCLMSGILACALSFMLNISWILSRKSILWWIHRAERIGRVRVMVEAMEKYRHRQMDTLHDKYQKKVTLLRDNYHSQMEQLRVSYSSQVDRFRDYRAAQMENVSAHVETMRDNYNQQMGRVREYGAKRAEQLWESYERQVNRVRLFNLQSRLKIMRQYNLKQRYINKLFESLQQNADMDTVKKHEAKVMAVLDLPEPRLARSASFHSLPEYVIASDGTLQPSPYAPMHVQHPSSTSFEMSDQPCSSKQA